MRVHIVTSTLGFLNTHQEGIYHRVPYNKVNRMVPPVDKNQTDWWLPCFPDKHMSGISMTTEMEAMNAPKAMDSHSPLFI